MNEREKDLMRGVEYIGVNVVFCCHDGKGNFLFSRRSARCRDEQGKWDCGAGAMEFGESFEDAIKRELKEEYHADPIHSEYIGSRNVVREHEGKKTHWIANIHLVRVDPAAIKIADHEKIDAIGWFRLDDLPTPLHSQVPAGVEMLQKYLNSNYGIS